MKNYVQILNFFLRALAAIIYKFIKTIIHTIERPCHHKTATDEYFWFIKRLIQCKLKCFHKKAGISFSALKLIYFYPFAPVLTPVNGSERELPAMRAFCVDYMLCLSV